MPKSKVDEELLLKVAKNSRISLSQEEVKKFLPQFNEILEAFEKLDELSVENVKPSFQPVQVKNRVRKDIPKESLALDLALSLTPHKKNEFFKGPKVVE